MKASAYWACALLFACAGAQADTMRCGSALASTGDRAWEVEQKCGAPLRRDLVGYTLAGSDQHEYQVEEWVYNQGNGAIYILRFEGNQLKSIEFKRN